MARKFVGASCFCLGASLFAFAVAASAQTQPEADAADTEAADTEIIVTAQRRDESLSKTPVAVAVISADTLAKAQIVSEHDLRAAVPGLSVRSGINSNQLNYSLRGQSQDANSETRPGVLPYINEVQIGGSGGSTAFYDLQSVQVLKGPQGTLFGRSATGGAVLFTTAKPTDDFGGYVSLSVGNFEAAKIEGALNVPIAGEALLARVAGFYQERDGFQTNLYSNSRVGKQQREGVRASLTSDFGTVRNEFMFDYLHSDSQNMVAILSGLYNGGFIPLGSLYAGTATPLATATGQATLAAFVPPAFAPFVPGFYNAYFADPNHPAGGLVSQLTAQQARGPFVVNSDANNLFRQKNAIVSNTTTIDLGGGSQIKNIFGYTHLKTANTGEGDGTPYTIAANGILGSTNAKRITVRQISEELQLGGKVFGDRLDYVAGIYFSDERRTNLETSQYFDLIFGGQSQNNHFVITNKTYAGYAQGTYKPNDAGLAFTLGARYTSEKVGKIVLPTDSFSVAVGGVAPPGYSFDQSATFNRLSGQIGVQQQVNPDLLLYAVSRRAYKSGGFNGTVPPRVADGTAGGDAFKTERVTDAELGAKLNGRVGGMPVRANVAFFHNWISNSQRVAYTLIGGNPAVITVNVPSAKTYGAEFDAQIRPAAWLTLGGNFNYTHASFASNTLLANGIPQIFDTVPDTPKYSGTVFADVKMPIGDSMVLALHGDVYAQSLTHTSSQSTNNAGTDISGYALANFRLGVEEITGGWSLTANVKNAFNRRYFVGGLPVGAIYQINLLVPGEPRTFALEARLNF
ncbi:MAG: TonB-dependent receptor plug domain-containing protein [Sphingorhabdus sp.]